MLESIRIIGCAKSANNNLFPGKGRFLVLTSIAFVPIGKTEILKVALGVPEKFEKLLSRENDIWERDVKERALEALGADASEDLIERALAGEPIPYLQGFVFFKGMRFQVSRDVMIPRSASEVLVNCAVSHIKKKWSENAEDIPKILDLGVGSGALLLATVHELDSLNAMGTGVVSTNSI